MFQTSVIDLLSPKLKFNIHLTKSPTLDHIYKFCLYMLEEHNYVFQSLNIAPMFENNNLSYTTQNHSSVTILKHFVYGWKMNITAEF